MTWRILSLALKQEGDIVSARQRARRVAELLGFGTQDQTRIATAVSEIARNAYSYGAGGRVNFELQEGQPPSLLVTISDEGPGIKNLDDVLSGQFTSENGMGVGIVGARRLMDTFDIESSDKGVSITLGKAIPAGKLRVTRKDIAGIAKALHEDASNDGTLEEARSTNRELLATLEELRLRQEELAQLNAELQDTNRGVVALYAELDQTAEKLRAASEAKSRFLSHISHEFRTPLNSIKALSGLLIDQVDGPLTSEQSRQVGYIRKSADSLTDLVNDLLDIAKVEAGKIDVHVAPFSASELFAGLRGLMKPLQATSEAQLIFEEPAGVGVLFSDEAKVAQILRNLISNALKFTERGEVRVTAAREGDTRVRFVVADTGVGLSPEDQVRIFEEFEQVRSPLQAKSKGTGLGLPLSRRLAELLGGSLSVESEVGKGSRFTLLAPSDLRPAETTSQKVLLVDDEEAFRYAMRQMIGPAHDVVEAADGVAAVQAIETRRPDVVFLDLNMPRLDGFAVLKTLADSPGGRDVKVIISTSRELSERDRARLDRADYILSKDQLTRETISTLLGAA